MGPLNIFFVSNRINFPGWVTAWSATRELLHNLMGWELASNSALGSVFPSTAARTVHVYYGPSAVQRRLRREPTPLSVDRLPFPGTIQTRAMFSSAHRVLPVTVSSSGYVGACSPSKLAQDSVLTVLFSSGNSFPDSRPPSRVANALVKGQ